MKKPGSSRPKAAAEKLPPLPWWERLLALPRRIRILGVAAALVAIIAVFFFRSPRQEASPQAPPQAADVSSGRGGENFLEQPIGPSLPPPPENALTPAAELRPTVQSIRFNPSQPTRLDTLKAEVVTAPYDDPRRITYTYVWKVNDRIVADAAGDTLNLEAFKKRDLVTVTVTPSDGDNAGFPVNGPAIPIYGAPPSLDLQVPVNMKRSGGAPLELRLISLHPDSDGITFSLEAPFVPGMSINGQTGRITWINPPNQKGAIRFGAAVEDADKTKVTKTFEITME